MQFFLGLLVALLCIAISHAFTPFQSSRIVNSIKSLQNKPSTFARFAVNNKKSDNSKNAKNDVDASEFWPGDWVCADCGYVYDKDIDGGGLYFEQQQKGFICPQCSAPRRRYAKKVGDEWGVTRDGGDIPIYAFTFLGLGIVTWFSLYYVPTL